MEPWTLKQEMEPDNDHATMSEPFSMAAQNIYFTNYTTNIFPVSLLKQCNSNGELWASAKAHLFLDHALCWEYVVSLMKCLYMCYNREQSN